MCEKEPRNGHDTSAVVVKKGSLIVGHIPHNICLMFPRHGVTISCRVTSSRHYSVDLPGELEISCILIFTLENSTEVITSSSQCAIISSS